LQQARLIWTHDPYHAHAISGALALAHFIARWFILLTTGRVWLPSEPLLLKIALVSVHVLAPVLSLVLPVHARRNMGSLMIWPEFRMHSLVFATRHVLATIVALTLPLPSWRPLSSRARTRPWLRRAS
jgi:hypothetical protein